VNPLDGLLEEMRSDPRISAAVASDPASAAHLAAVEALFA
jgi:hypothetical protein